jgi:hypothetical protein
MNFFKQPSHTHEENGRRRSGSLVGLVFAPRVHCRPSDGGWGNGDGQVEYTLYFRMEFSTPLEEWKSWVLLALI